MVISDLFGFIKRNLNKMSEKDLQRTHKEMKQILYMLEKKMKGDGQYVG